MFNLQLYKLSSLWAIKTKCLIKVKCLSELVVWILKQLWRHISHWVTSQGLLFTPDDIRYLSKRQACQTEEKVSHVRQRKRCDNFVFPRGCNVSKVDIYLVLLDVRALLKSMSYQSFHSEVDHRYFSGVWFVNVHPSWVIFINATSPKCSLFPINMKEMTKHNMGSNISFLALLILYETLYLISPYHWFILSEDNSVYLSGGERNGMWPWVFQ